MYKNEKNIVVILVPSSERKIKDRNETILFFVNNM